MSKLIFKGRASSVDALLSKPVGTITIKQLGQIVELENKGKVKPLTEKQKETLSGLIKKREESPYLPLTDGAKEFVLTAYLRNEYDITDEMANDATNKGIFEEDTSIALLSKVDGVKYVKNEHNLFDDFFTGTPDIITKSKVIDIKTSKTAKSFARSGLTRQYDTQLQVYMHLLGLQEAELIYCLVNTPQYQIDRKYKNLYYDMVNQFGEDFESDPSLNHEYESKCTQILLNNTFGRIPRKDRVKRISVQYKPEVIKTLQDEIKRARTYYSTLKLNKRNG